MKKIIILILLTIAIASLYFDLSTEEINLIQSKTIQEINNLSLKTYFCRIDNCEEQMLKLINNAKSSIHCALFDLDLENIITALKQKSGDIDVKLDRKSVV